MSKQNKQKRARHYADAVADHIRRTRAQQLRCAAENEKLDEELTVINNSITVAFDDITTMEKHVAELKDTVINARKAFETFKESVGLRQQVTRSLVSDITQMATVIQATASRIGIDLSNVEAADEAVAETLAAVEAVEEASAAAVADEVTT